MLQKIDGIPMFVVDLDTMPELPITGANSKERIYASALTDAIKSGQITKPGKYGISVDKYRNRYDIYEII